MQATYVRPECPKSHILGSNKSVLQNLATELLVEIFQHLGWEDVFVMRRTCKLFFDISTSRPLWVCLFYRLSSEARVPPILERPISAYTAEELEYVVMRRISSEIRWETGAPPRVHVLSMLDWDANVDPDYEVHDEVLLLDGGRWLLSCRRRNCWRIYAHNLDMSFSASDEEPRHIIDLNSEGQGWHLVADVDRDTTSELVFILCLVPWSTIRPPDSPSDWAPEQIHIYRLTVKGRGTEAKLEAHKLKSLPTNDLLGINEMIDMRGHYLVRSIYELDPSFYHCEVCNWLLSDSTVQFKTYLQHDQNDSGVFDDVILISDDKAAIISNNDISLYDVSNLPPISAGETLEMRQIEPYWKLTDPRLSGEVFYSNPYPDAHATRTTIIIDDAIYGLTIPHKIQSDNTPIFQRISDIEIPSMSMTCVGRNKIYAHDSNEGTIRIVSFLWPDDYENRDVSLLLPAPSQPSQHQLCLPYEWDHEEPLLDDVSNRVLSLVNGSFVVLDFGYK